MGIYEEGHDHVVRNITCLMSLSAYEPNLKVSQAFSFKNTFNSLKKLSKHGRMSLAKRFLNINLKESE